eukprot:6181555-Pleurochrysis_carterae.AAC.9
MPSSEITKHPGVSNVLKVRAKFKSRTLQASHPRLSAGCCLHASSSCLRRSTYSTGEAWSAQGRSVCRLGVGRVLHRRVRPSGCIGPEKIADPIAGFESTLVERSENEEFSSRSPEPLPSTPSTYSCAHTYSPSSRISSGVSAGRSGSGLSGWLVYARMTVTQPQSIRAKLLCRESV